MSEQPQVLLVIDVQNGFVTPQSEHVVRPLENLQYEFDYVIFTKFYNPDPSPFRKFVGYDRMKQHSAQTDLTLQPRDDAVIISRPLYSGVTEALLVRLKTWGMREVFIAGIATDSSVLKTAIDLFELNIRPWVLQDLCASDKGADFHDAGLKILGNMIGPQHIINSCGPEADVVKR
ncbi:isochorismatase family cysteine hydrolase [Asticcacaulis sp. 201]|uniref:isochorismatase family cysteine hydrolase n=1 Tax=Asticcacaulis sp. 201 TaxID=3028787 RepID=UPI002916D515|nr:isochorismatase family cysteine hydrolase [Asticcacaulis sp. 201]MDV6332283.1 isochorismatase family cysteine hydrolase [Asticcacaulis sp. 201]